MEKITLKNKVTILVEEMPSMQSAAVGIFVKNGSRNESAEESGISHFIEHMLFKGTENRSAEEIAAEVDAMGGQLNAYTTKEYTCYYTRVLAENFQAAADILSDMYFNSKFDDEDIKKELGVIIEEINMYEDTPEDLVYEQLQSEIWKNNALGRAILGTKESISKFKHIDFKNYMKKHYRPDNTVISVAGKVKVKDVVEVIEKYFGDWKYDLYETKIITPIYTPSHIYKTKDIEQKHICITYEGLPLTDEDNYNMSVLNTLAGGGMSSVLFRKIREERGLAYTIYSFASSFVDTGTFTVYMGLNSENEELAVNIVRQELENIKMGNFSDLMVEKSKQQLKNNFLLGQESTSSVMTAMGRSFLMKGNVLSVEETLREVNKVNKERVEKLARRIFDFNKESISVVAGK